MSFLLPWVFQGTGAHLKQSPELFGNEEREVWACPVQPQWVSEVSEESPLGAVCSMEWSAWTDHAVCTRGISASGFSQSLRCCYRHKLWGALGAALSSHLHMGMVPLLPPEVTWQTLVGSLICLFGISGGKGGDILRGGCAKPRALSLHCQVLQDAICMGRVCDQQ